MKRYKIGWFSGSMPIHEKIKRAVDIQVGDVYYSQDIGGDKDWRMTMKRENMVRIQITSTKKSNGKFDIDFGRVKNGKFVIKKYSINADKLFLFIKTGKIK